MVVDVKEELDPRTVLLGQVERFARAGQTPVAAVELEFYVTRKSSNGAFVLHTPEGLSDDPGRPLTFGFEEMDALSPFIDDIYRICEVQRLPVDAVMQESGPGQFEINLKERADAVGAALDGLLLKRAVKAAARAHGLEATFMAKPHHDWAGSGMHIHLSLLDQSGQNLFAGDPISPLFRHALGGMRDTMADFMAVWAQSANAYRRYVPKSYVSMAAHWGFNNRTVALRIPRSNGTATRIEHRVAGADANPYLVIASILAGMRHGMTNSIDPGPAVEGNSDDDRGAASPDRLGQLARSLPALGGCERGLRRTLPGCILQLEACRAQQFRAHRHPARLPLVFASGLRPAMTVFVMFDGDCQMTMISKKFPAAALIDGEWVTSAKTFSVHRSGHGCRDWHGPRSWGQETLPAPSTQPPARCPPGPPRPRRSAPPSSGAGSISSPPRPRPSPN